MLTYIIIGLTCLVSIPAFQNRELFVRMLFSPTVIQSRNEWHRFITHALLHADFLHLFMNMYVMFIFGGMVEGTYTEAFEGVRGQVYFVVLYVSGIIASSIPSYFQHKENYHYNSVGASGAVSAIVFAAILLDPSMKLSIMFIPIGIPAPIFGVLYLVYCRYMEKQGGDNVAHDVHYWGSIYGALFTAAILPGTIPQLIEAVKNLF